jgi:hypothetical protein
MELAVCHHSCSPQKRLLFLSTDMGIGGGAEEQVIQLVCGLKARGWQVMIVSMLAPTPMPPDFAESGIQLLHLGMRRGMPSASSLFNLAKIIRRFRPGVVHNHMVHANLLARVVRIVQPMAGVQRDWSPIYEIAHRVTDRFCDKTTAICHAASDHCVKRRAVPRAARRIEREHLT